jgi:hypothetical protein
MFCAKGLSVYSILSREYEEQIPSGSLMHKWWMMLRSTLKMSGSADWVHLAEVMVKC